MHPEYSSSRLPLLQLTHRSDLGILVGRWGYQPEPHELPPVYEQVKQAAVQHNSRFWLQDIRRRTLNDPETTHWLLKTFFPAMAKKLGGRLYVAYLVGPELHQAIISQPSFVSAGAYDNRPYAIDFFGDEGAAIRWLHTQQLSTHTAV